MMMGLNGIQLDSFHYKRNQKITITGQVADNDELYAFQDNLASNPDIRNIVPNITVNTRSTTTNSRVGTNTTNNRGGTSAVNNRNARSAVNNRGGMNRGNSRSPGGVAGGLKFNITFDYKTFTTAKK